MSAEDWLKEHQWTEEDFTNNEGLNSIKDLMELFANHRILEALKVHNIDIPYCFCEKPIPVINNKSKCANEFCERQINRK